MEERVSAAVAPSAERAGLARRLGLFDATMIVMGGIVGSGIFMNPYVVARQVGTPFLILSAWALGGLIALTGAFIYAELAARRPSVGGQYAYIREAFHPLPAFIYAWSLLLVIQTGGMAAVALTFARYFLELVPLSLSDWAVAALALGALTLVNCLGVKAGSAAQNVLMVAKIVAILVLIGAGLFAAPASPVGRGTASPLLDRPLSFDLLTAMGAAMVPVLFAYGGWQTSCFVAGEIREPRKNLPRGLLLGVTGVVVLYLLVNFVCLRVLGTAGLAATTTPASDVMHVALGATGGRLIAAGIAISTLGFLSQSMLTGPRVYYAMAADGLFFEQVAWLHPRTQVPVVAILLQGTLALLIALSGQYERILNYVVSVDWIFFGLTALCVFRLRRQDRESGTPREVLQRIPGHPLTTGLFVLASVLVVANTLYQYPVDSAVGLAILAAGVPVYGFWRWKGARWARRTL